MSIVSSPGYKALTGSILNSEIRSIEGEMVPLIELKQW